MVIDSCHSGQHLRQLNSEDSSKALPEGHSMSYFRQKILEEEQVSLKGGEYIGSICITR